MASDMPTSTPGEQTHQAQETSSDPPGITDARFKILRIGLGHDDNKLFSHLKKTGVGNIHAALKSLDFPESVSAESASRLQFSNFIAEAAQDDVLLSSAILEDPKIASLRDVALHYGFERVKALASRADAERTVQAIEALLKLIPHYESSTVQALRFQRRIFELEPTAVLQQMISDKAAGDNPSAKLPLHSNDQILDHVARFLDERPDFDIRLRSVLAEIAADQHAGGFIAKLDRQTRHQVVESLKLLQRTQALAQTPEVIQPLVTAGMTSALRVASMPRRKFVKVMSPKIAQSSGVSSEEATALAINLHDHATLSRARTDSALVQLHQTLKGSGLAALDGSTNLTERKKLFQQLVAQNSNAQGILDLDSLFQDMDMCECASCEDITSPTAYYVDLLQYLRNNNLDDVTEWENTGKEGYSDTVLEKLFLRRPDLQHLELTCKNANTVLPYIDLANEVMESFVIHLETYAADWTASKQVSLETWNVEPADESEELLAVPAHTRKPAYCILKEAVYPIASLPYFQPLDAMRLYLHYLGVTRYELIDTFRTTTGQWRVPAALLTDERRPLYDELRHQLQDRATVAEYLSLSPDEYVVITRESIWPIRCSLLSDRGILLTEEQYRRQIGVRSPEEYWGYTAVEDLLSIDSSDRVGLTWVKAQYLRRAGLSYAETVDLVKTYYVNPMMPHGKDRILMDATRFSFRFLQRLALLLSNTTSKIDAISNFLYVSQPWVHLIRAAQAVPKGNALLEDSSSPSFTKKEIRRWVSRWFDCIGQLIVLESGQGPRLPVKGYILHVPAKREVHLTSESSSLDEVLALIESWRRSTSSDSRQPLPSSSPSILGYLDADGGVFDPTNNLIGAVAVNGQVLYQDGKPIRMRYPSGQLVVIDIPRNPDNLDNAARESIVRNLLTVSIDEESYLEMYRWDAEVRVRVQWIIPNETCSIENTRLMHLNGSSIDLWEWDRISRFIRLYRKLHVDTWTILELDAALKGLWRSPDTPTNSGGSLTSPDSEPDAFSFFRYRDKSCDCTCEEGVHDGCCDSEDDGEMPLLPCDPRNFVNITPDFLKELRSIRELSRLTGLRDELLILWTVMDTTSDKSPFRRKFVTKDLQRIDSVFQPDVYGNYLASTTTIREHIPVLLAALQIKSGLFDRALERASLSRDSILSISNLTKLYRLTVLANILGISFAVVLDALDLFSDPFVNASRTLDVYRNWNRISTAGFSIAQLRYIAPDVTESPQHFGPKQLTILKTTKTLLDGMAAIETAHPDLTSHGEAVASENFVKTKVALLFPPSVVETIVGIVEGTAFYTTNAPAGLAVDATALSPKLIYTTSSNPALMRATLSVKGILTDAEEQTALAAFPGNDAWESAFARLRKQAVNRVKSVLTEVFGDGIDEALAVLTKGDVAAIPPASETDTGHPGTAPEKRTFLIRALMPFLRHNLKKQFIITTVAGIVGVSSELTLFLLESVIRNRSGSSWKSGLSILEAVSTTVSETPLDTWTGYLIPVSTDSYSFHTYSTSEPTQLLLDGRQIDFTHQGEDPNDQWWTHPVALKGGKLYTMATKHPVTPGNLFWKTNRSDVVVVPQSCLIPGMSVAEVDKVFQQISRASILIDTLKLDIAEVEYLQTHGSNFDRLDFNGMRFGAFLRLLSYVELRDSVPRREKTLVDLFLWASQTPATASPGENIDSLSVPSMVSSVTGWDAGLVARLVDSKGFDFPKTSFTNELALTKLNAAVKFIQKIGQTDSELLFQWIDLKLDFDTAWSIAKSILHTIRSKYTLEDFGKAIKPTHDQLRKNQRDALIAYLLVQDCLQRWGVEDADGLFEFFLIDVQMGSCMQTSRIKQAISSVQQFVQRVMLGLEEHEDPKIHVPNDALDATRWQWMSNQTVWTANRKVFLYPENWLIPSLRDNKTPTYTTMEGELLQQELNSTNIVESFKGFVTNMDQISHLRAVGLHVEKTGPATHLLHFVAMTPAAPFTFFHRSFDSSSHEWRPWSQIEADIPSYTQEYTYAHGMGEHQPETIEVLNGCYVVPYVWKSRLLLFIGQLSAKTVANDAALDTTFGQMTNPDSNESARTMTAKQCWEIKLGFTEYRSGRWTQKAVSADSILTSALETLSPADAFQFFPKRIVPEQGPEYVSIEVWQCFQDPKVPTAPVNNGAFIGEFVFRGSVLSKGDLLWIQMPTNWIATNFHFVNGRSQEPVTSSLQKNEDGTLPYFNREPCVKSNTKDPSGEVFYDATNKDLFFHPFTNLLLEASSRTVTKIDPILKVFASVQLSDPAIADVGFGAGPEENGFTTYAEMSRPYANYNWDVGFHAPMQIAQNLLASQQFDNAFEMIHHVFNPYADGPDSKRVWQWPPFKDAESMRVLEAILDRLKPREFDRKVTQWRDHPFQPYTVARGRTVAYMKWTVATYIKALIAYGDYFFRRRTLEDLPRALQLYVVASRMYGAKGETIPKQGTKIPQTYFSLLDKWDAFSNAAVQLELVFPFSNQTPFAWHMGQVKEKETPGANDIALANIFGLATSSYFCLPTNPELQALRTTIDTRLFNLRNCLDIDGKPMPLALWEPPIDPAQLVAAVASGLSLSSALNDLNASLPNYRFTWLLAKAFEICAELKTLENTFLSIKEKRDGEAMSRLRTSHEITMSEKTMEMKKVQLEEAIATAQTLEASQESPRFRHAFYASLAGADVEALGSGEQFRKLDINIEAPVSGGDVSMNPTEQEEAKQASEAQVWNHIAAGHEVLAGILHAVPSFNIHSTPMGCGVEVQWGMPNIASSIQAKARSVQILASHHSFKSTEAARKAQSLRQYQDRISQLNLAGFEYEHINTQIAAHKFRIKLASLDIDNQQKAIDNANEIDQFLRNKYTNDELYQYLETSTRQHMYQTYQLAYDLAKKAELAFRFERRATEQQDFISFGYWDPGRDGLQSGQKLYLALKQMETVYQSDKGYDFEISKSVSLRQLNPYALLTLRETGACQIDLPEVLFDMDFPGHYFRRLKTVSLTIPCVTGPYTSVNATLRLLSHRYRWNPVSTGSGKDYLERMEGKLDDRFRTDHVPIDAIAASTAQNDAGVFELSIRDERYLPFEGAGTVGSWHLQLPSFAQFDYKTIADVILTIRYTACDGGMLLRKAAAESVADFVATVEGYSQSQGLMSLFDLRSEFATEWAKLTVAVGNSTDADADVTQTLVLRDLSARLPAFTLGRSEGSVRATDISLLTTLPMQPDGVAVNFKYVPPDPEVGDTGEYVAFDSGPTKIGKNLSMLRLSEADTVFGTWGLKITLPAGTKMDGGTRMWMIVRYKLGKS